MPSSQRTYWPIIGVSCLLIIVILLIILWPYRELIGFLVVGLAVLAVLVTLALWVIRTMAAVRGKLNEQELRRERLRPNDDGYYEIPLDRAKVPMPPPQQKGQVPYYQRYEPKDSSNRGWD